MSVVFFHAHPDDESIFTGGTIARLADTGVRTVVVLATGSDREGDDLSALERGREARAACDVLGVASLHLLGYADAGAGDADAPFHAVDVDEAARHLATILLEEGATTLVVYDEGGIYAHVDHLAVHRVGVAAAAAAGLETVYEATVDREYLHFVETHLVGHAVEWLAGADAVAAINRAPLGVPTVEVTTMIDVRAVIDRKRRAIEAHASQIPAGGALRSMDDETFEAVYGYEWFVRRGPAGVLDDLAS
ncbi:MAG: PIG-L deacetylase family protein [Acidimicrobiales bacterium]